MHRVWFSSFTPDSPRFLEKAVCVGQLTVLKRWSIAEHATLDIGQEGRTITHHVHVAARSAS